MRIFRTANEFEDEGRDPLEQVEDRSHFDAEQEMKDRQEKGMTHTSQILSDITPSFVERLDANYTVDGAEAWFEYKDGKVYHVIVKPAHPLHNILDSSGLDSSDDLPMS